MVVVYGLDILQIWDSSALKIFIDIDETICSKSYPDYGNAQPLSERINFFNKLYEIGYTIIYWTARGSTSGKDWSDLTKNQLETWGVKHHELRMNKPDYDIFICDKAIKAEDAVKELMERFSIS